MMPIISLEETLKKVAGRTVQAKEILIMTGYGVKK
jgi:hypothetical protein